jgi:hypothetical protein
MTTHREHPPTVAFDAYECSIEAPLAEVVATLARELQADTEVLGAISRWSFVVELKRGDRTLATVKESAQRPDECHLDCKSTAHELVPLIRTNWPHRVSRVDACIDLYDDTYWEVLEYMLLKWANEKNEYTEPAGPHTQPHLGGRTWYKGNRHKKPQRLVRLYEKGCERQLKTRWPIRLEHQVRPKSLEKRRYSTMTAAEVLLENPFIRHALAKLQIDLGDAPSPIPHQPRHELDRILDVLARQYLETIKACRNRFETLAELQQDLEARIERDREVKAAMQNAQPTVISQQSIGNLATAPNLLSGGHVEAVSPSE